MMQDYVHGYDTAERRRLRDQAGTLAELLHHDTSFAPGSLVLEAGCGVGAQTPALIRHSPGATFTCVDISAASLAEAEARIRESRLPCPTFRHADLERLPFPDGMFDHVFVCFVLEHVRRPGAVLAELRRVLRPGGSLTVIEGDHGSTLFHPPSAAAQACITALVDLQRAAGGDALIGRRLYPLLADAGFGAVHVTPRAMYVDASRPDLAEGFIRRTFTAMVAAVRNAAVDAGSLGPTEFDAGIAALLRTTAADGAFCYTFFKAVAFKTPLES